MSIVRLDDSVTTATGQAIAGAQVYFLLQPANLATLQPLATVYADMQGNLATNPLITDGFGHVAAYLDNTRLYTQVVVHPLLGQIAYPDQGLVGGGGGGTTPTPFAGGLTGVIDGVNKTFGLPVVPIFLTFTRNGVYQTPGLDFNLAGKTITCAIAPLPVVNGVPGDSLFAQGF